MTYTPLLCQIKSGITLSQLLFMSSDYRYSLPENGGFILIEAVRTIHSVLVRLLICERFITKIRNLSKNTWIEGALRRIRSVTIRMCIC